MKVRDQTRTDDASWNGTDGYLWMDTDLCAGRVPFKRSTVPERADRTRCLRRQVCSAPSQPSGVAHSLPCSPGSPACKPTTNKCYRQGSNWVVRSRSGSILRNQPGSPACKSTVLVNSKYDKCCKQSCVSWSVRIRIILITGSRSWSFIG
jgi:hypothetical protein